MTADPIDVLEAAYDFDGAEEVWLERVLGAIHPLLDHGMGTAAFLFRVDEGGLHVGALATRGLDGAAREALRQTHRAFPPEYVTRLYVDPPPCSTAATALGWSLRRDPVAKREFLPRVNVPDVLGLRANSAPREGAFFRASLHRRGCPPPREAALLSRLASQIGAGLRLRRRLAEAARCPLDDADAILTPGGRLAHAAGPARDEPARGALARATRSIDRARGRLRRADPEEAVALWRTLVSGHWSLVDHFDHDGRRFVVAHRNPMRDERPDLARLSDRERQTAMLAALGHSNKLIAYDLGVSLSTVSEYVGRASAKLGASSRVSLIRIVRSLLLSAK